MSAAAVGIGIDLGTTNSVVACATAEGIAVVPAVEGHRLHPSVVAFKPSGERSVGLPARLRRVIDPRNTVFSAKRLIGLPFRAPSVQTALLAIPYKVEEGPDQESVIATRAGRFTVPQIASFLLGHLREQAERHLGAKVASCVVTVPANFSDGQRQATRRAAELAGMEVMRILNEPTAAALAYGMGGNVDQRIVVFDLGGGTFDVTALAVRKDLFEVLATGGDPFLGGDDMDLELARRLAQSFLVQRQVDLHQRPESFALLLIAAEQIKAKLSTDLETTGSIHELAHGEGGRPLSLDFQVTRAELDDLIAPLVDRAILRCEQVLADAGLSPQQVDEVVLVGGGTRVPLVRRRVIELFGRQPRADINPMEVVAQGAALHAAHLIAPQVTAAPLLIDVVPHALGLATVGGYTDVLIARNEPLPAERTRVFTTATDNQQQVVIRVCQGAERVFAANVSLGELRLDQLRPARRGEVAIEVTFLVDADGILQVSARDRATGRAERAVLRVPGIG